MPRKKKTPPRRVIAVEFVDRFFYADGKRFVAQMTADNRGVQVSKLVPYSVQAKAILMALERTPPTDDE